MRVKFCGVIEGSVALRNGESEAAALQRAEDAICNLLARSAKNYRREPEDGGGEGPIVGLEYV